MIKRRLMKLILLPLAIVMGLYLLVVALVYFNQASLLYFPPQTLPALTPADRGMPYEDVWLTTEDGVRIHSWYIPLEGARGTVIYFHGNGGAVNMVIEEATPLHGMGLNVLLVEYRGYGLSEGTPTEAGLYADARAAYAYLVDERGIPPTTIIVAGHSLGGGVAVALASERPVAGLLIISSFTSTVAVAQERYPWLPVQRLSRHRYPSAARLPSIRVPVFISHGTADRTIGFHHGQTLYALANEPKTFMALDSGHVPGLEALAEQQPDALHTFIDSVLAPQPTRTR